MPVLGKMVTVTASALVSSTGAKVVLFRPPEGKRWHLLGYYLSGTGSGDTTTSGVSLFSGSNNFAVNPQITGTGVALQTTTFTGAVIVAVSATNIGGTAGAPVSGVCGEKLLLIDNSGFFRVNFTISAKVSNEIYDLTLLVREFDTE